MIINKQFSSIMERQMYHYATVSKALEELAEKGFSTDFNLDEKRIVENPNDFEIVHIYRYEGESDPGDEATVYGIKSTSGEKGVFVAGDLSLGEKSATKVLNDLTIKGREN
jgi:rubrerythrin